MRGAPPCKNLFFTFMYITLLLLERGNSSCSSYFPWFRSGLGSLGLRSRVCGLSYGAKQKAASVEKFTRV